MNRSISWIKVVALAVALVMVLSGCGATSGGKTNGAAQASAGGGQAGKAEGVISPLHWRLHRIHSIRIVAVLL